MKSDKAAVKRRYSAADWTDFAHTGPETLAGRYLRLFWQPVYRAKDLAPKQTKPVRIMSEDFTLYRGESGAPYAVAFRCAHRGTQLSVGSVEGETLRCFYHGWRYDGAGQCVEQPAEPKPFCEKVRIRSYPTKEYLGLIFAYMGEGKPPDLPRYPAFERDDYEVIIYPTQQCNWFNRMENAVDQVHVRFVHWTSGLTGCPQVWAKETSYGIAVKTAWPEVKERSVHGCHYEVPNASHFHARGGEKVAWRVPVDDEHYISFNVEPFQKGRREAESGAPAPVIGAKILSGEMQLSDLSDTPNLFELQDYIAQVGQGVIAERENDQLGAEDIGITLLRKIWMRELRALAERRPLKKWTRPERFIYPDDPTWDNIR